MRLLQQLSQVYSTMSVTALQELVPFMPFEAVEQVIVEAVKYDFIQVRMHVSLPACYRHWACTSFLSVAAVSVLMAACRSSKAALCA